MLIARAAASLRLFLLGVLALLAAPGSVSAQDGQAGAAPAGTGDAVQIGVLPFGVGGVVRAGEWAGIRLVLSDSGTRPRGVAARLHLRDDDGDTLLAERRVILNPGRQEGVWLYVRMPWRLSQQSIFTVTVHELVESGDAGRPTIGRQLGATRIQPSREPLNPERDLFGVIGRRSLGLAQYENRSALIGGEGQLDISNEVIQTVVGLSVEELPDSWEGLAPYTVLVWGEGQPSELGADLKPDAIREWVRRGGHFVIVLPPVGGEWFAAENPLSDLLPAGTVRRVEGASLEPYRRLLVSPEMTGVELPTDTTIHVFEIGRDVAPGDATPVIDGVHGTVVARRAVGTGLVTVVGLDLGHRGLARASLPRADQFWNRVLGKRLETPSPEKIEELGREAFPSRRFGGEHYADQYFNLEIAKRTAAGIGVLLALIVFIAYWIVAGPGGFGLLRVRGLEQHSWVWFAGSIAVFAAAAWLGANAIRETKTSGQHLTFLDHVYGQPVQHAGTWVSVLLPSYGEETILLGDPELSERRQAIAVWSDSNGQAATMSFPDARSYVVDVRSPQTLTVPSRATIKQFELDWLGPKRWSTPIPVGEGWEPRLDGSGAIRGRLVHDLPVPLEDVMILVSRGQLEPGEVDRQEQAPLLFEAVYKELGEAWVAGAPLDLAEVFAEGARGAGNLLKQLRPAQRNDFSLAQPTPTSIRPNENTEDYERIALYSLLPEPRYGELSVTDRPPPVRRREAHVWDLGKWFAQPCVVIIGHVREAESPTPLFVRRGDRWQEVPLTGRTVVRWVYLLDPDPPVFAYDLSSRDAGADADGVR